MLVPVQEQRNLKRRELDKLRQELERCRHTSAYCSGYSEHLVLKVQQQRFRCVAVFITSRSVTMWRPKHHRLFFCVPPYAPQESARQKSWPLKSASRQGSLLLYVSARAWRLDVQLSTSCGMFRSASLCLFAQLAVSVFLQAQQRYAYRLQKAEEEERLAEDLLKRSHAAAAQQTALERLHQTSPELQELRQAIAAAQVLGLQSILWILF